MHSPVEKDRFCDDTVFKNNGGSMADFLSEYSAKPLSLEIFLANMPSDNLRTGKAVRNFLKEYLPTYKER